MIPAILAPFKGLLIKGAIGLAAFAVVGLLLWRNNYLDEQRALAEQQLIILQDAYNDTVDQYESQLDAMENVAQEQATRAASTAVIKEEIRDSTDAEDGPVAPVLQRTLDRLRERAGSTD